MNSYNSTQELEKRLRLEYESNIPIYGLNSSRAERIARLNNVLGNDEVAQRYFLLAAKKLEDNLHKSDKLNEKGFYLAAVTHTAMLFYYINDEAKIKSLVNIVRQEAGTTFKEVRDTNRSTGNILTTLLYASLLDLEIGKAREHLDELKDVYEEDFGIVKMPEREVLLAIEMIINAVKLKDKKLANEAIQYLGSYLDENDIPVDSTRYLTPYDVLELLKFVSQELIFEETENEQS